MKQVSQVLRSAMVDAEKKGISLYRIAKACDLDDSIVYRFYHNECGLALTSVDRLCVFLGLELTESDQPGEAFRMPARASAAETSSRTSKKKKTSQKKMTKKKAKTNTTKKAARKTVAKKSKTAKKSKASATQKKKKAKRS